MAVIPTPKSIKCTCHYTEPILNRACSTCAAEEVENLIETVRAEIGNAGFAAAIGETALADQALIEAVRQIELVRTTLKAHA